MIEPIERAEAPAAEGAERCSNCGELLRGEFCARCGQHAREWQRPLPRLLSEVGSEFLSVDTRLLRTLRPLLFTPGRVTRNYLAGHRAPYLTPLKTYLLAALVFFGLFTIFPNRTPVYVITAGSPEAAAAKQSDRSRVAFSLPEHVPIFDRPFQEASARARANPGAFSLAVYQNVPRAFFLFLPLFALLLELFYRREGFYVDHLVFSLYYHAFVFCTFSVMFLVGRSEPILPGFVRSSLQVGLLVWLLAYLPLALRRVYGGTWLKTSMKVIGLGVLYAAAFALIGLPLVVFGGLATF